MAKDSKDKIWHPLTIKKADTSKEYAEYRRRWDENPKNFIVDDFPIHLDIETITSCNLRCTICFQSHAPLRRSIMEMDLYTKILDELYLYNLFSVKLHFRGEPLLDKRIPDFVKMAKERGVIETMINTNVTLLDEIMAIRLIESGLDKIICSIEGYTKDVYEKIRVGANFETVVNNVKRLAELKKEMNSSTPYIMARTIEMNDIDVLAYERFWEGTSDQVGYSDLTPQRGEECDTIRPDFACPQLWQRLIILADGAILPCCAALDWYGGRDIYLSLGNAHNDTIHDIWVGKRLNELRRLHMNGESHKLKICRQCRFCGFRGFK